MSSADNAWLEVSLTVEAEQAEAVAEVLARFISTGVVIESTSTGFDRQRQLAETGPLRVYGFLALDGQVEEHRHGIEQALWYLGRIQPLPPPTFMPIPEEDWTQAWKKNYRPVALGQRLLVQPSWIPLKDSNRIPIFIDPGMAFGTGTHPSTQLCLEFLEKLAPLGGDFIDIGCGSGILSIAAVKLGSGRALGVDVDPQAVQTALANAELNGVVSQTEYAVGSLLQILRGEFSLQTAQLVCANIVAPVLLKLLPQGLESLMRPEGLLVLSGLLLEQEAELLEAAQARGLIIRDRLEQGDWVALMLARS